MTLGNGNHLADRIFHHAMKNLKWMIRHISWDSLHCGFIYVAQWLAFAFYSSCFFCVVFLCLLLFGLFLCHSLVFILLLVQPILHPPHVSSLLRRSVWKPICTRQCRVLNSIWFTSIVWKYEFFIDLPFECHCFATFITFWWQWYLLILFRNDHYRRINQIRPFLWHNFPLPNNWRTNKRHSLQMNVISDWCFCWAQISLVLTNFSKPRFPSHFI